MCYCQLKGLCIERGITMPFCHWIKMFTQYPFSFLKYRKWIFNTTGTKDYTKNATMRVGTAAQRIWMTGQNLGYMATWIWQWALVSISPVNLYRQKLDCKSSRSVHFRFCISSWCKYSCERNQLSIESFLALISTPLRARVTSWEMPPGNTMAT